MKVDLDSTKQEMTVTLSLDEAYDFAGELITLIDKAFADEEYKEMFPLIAQMGVLFDEAGDSAEHHTFKGPDGECETCGRPEGDPVHRGMGRG